MKSIHLKFLKNSRIIGTNFLPPVKFGGSTSITVRKSPFSNTVSNNTDNLTFARNTVSLAFAKSNICSEYHTVWNDYRLITITVSHLYKLLELVHNGPCKSTGQENQNENCRQVLSLKLQESSTGTRILQGNAKVSYCR